MFNFVNYFTKSQLFSSHIYSYKNLKSFIFIAFFFIKTMLNFKEQVSEKKNIFMAQMSKDVSF